MNNIEVKRVTVGNIDQLQLIGKQTFFETFSATNTEENMSKYLEEGFSLERLRIEINDQNSEFYFAVLFENIIGYLKLNWGNSQTELKDKKALRSNEFMY